MQAPPYKIKVVEPIALPPAERRRDALVRAGYNTFLLHSDDVYIDLLTDSGTSAVSQEQRARMELGDESYAGSRSYFRLERAVREVYGYRHTIPTHQGRGAEHLLAKVLVRPGSLIPSNLYFTTSRAHAELAGGTWVDVAIPEASRPESTHPFKGNIDVEKLEALLSGPEGENVAFVRQEACLNMAGGQPFSIENLTQVRSITLDHNVPLILDATRSSENALFVKRREHGYAQRTLPDIVKLIADLSDGAIFSSKKDHFVPIGGLVAVNDDTLAEKLRELVVVYEGFPHYGGMSGAAMEALAQGIREAVDEPTVAHYVDQVAYLASLLRESDVPIVLPPGAHAVFLDAKRFLPHVPAGGVPRAGARRRHLSRRRCPHDGARHRLRPAWPRSVRRARARAPDAASPRVHAGAPDVRRRGGRRPLPPRAHGARPAHDVRAAEPALLPGAVRAARRLRRRLGRLQGVDFAQATPEPLFRTVQLCAVSFASSKARVTSSTLLVTCAM